MELYLDFFPFYGTEEEFLAIEDFEIKVWGKDGYIHRENGPAQIELYGIQRTRWMVNGNDLTYLFPMDYWFKK